jgi:hypothetical protein
MRAKFIASLGGLPTTDAPFAVQNRGTIREKGFSIEKIIYQSRTDTWVAANLYLPDSISRPTAAVLFLCGHFADARLADEYQTVCRHLVRAGLVVLAQDPIGQGERWSYWESDRGAPTVRAGTGEHDYAGWQSLLLGDGIARYFVHDAMRSIDYLRTRPEVDPERIGVTGNSGGGTQTSLVMVCDPRIAAAAPGTFIMSRETYMDLGQAQDAEQIWRGMTALGFDHEDLLLMMAPRPVLVLAVSSDFFPIEGTRRTVERCRRIWEICGAPESIELYEEPIEHHYSPTMADHAAEFFSRHLNGRGAPLLTAADEERMKPVAPRLLWCTGSGQVRGEIPGARAVHEENCLRLDEIEARRKSVADAQAREEAREWLRARVFKDRKPVDPVTKVWLPGVENGLTHRVLMWWSQERVMGAAALFRPHDRGDERLPVTIGLWQHGTAELVCNADWIHAECGKGRAVVVPDLSGMGMLTPNVVNSNPLYEYYGTMFKLAHDLIWLDDSMPALRTWELIRTVDVLASTVAEIDTNDLRVHAWGRYSVYAELAAFVDQRLKDVTVHDGLESLAGLVRARHYNDADISAVVMPEILRHLDLPDLRRWRKG